MPNTNPTWVAAAGISVTVQLTVPIFYCSLSITIGFILICLSLPVNELNDQAREIRGRANFSEEFKLSFTAADALEVQIEQRKDRLDNCANLLLNIVLIIDG